MLHRSFNRGVHKLINTVQWPMYVININNKQNCVCLNETNNESNPACPKCLGTGHKIKIRKIQAVKQPFKSAARAMGSSNSLNTLVSTYYIDAKYAPIKIGDMIVHEKEIDVIKVVKLYRTDSSKDQFYVCPAVLHKYDNDILIENFNKIIKK